MRNLLLLAFSVIALNLTSLYAQNVGYEPIKCQGAIPADFTTLSSVKVEKDIRTIGNNESSTEKNAKKDFYLESNFLLDNLLRSGKVMFNDEITNYVNRVADIVLSGDPELRKKLRFYTVKSPEVNAFTTNSGMIFVNIGLMAQLENEAELAFIISHEIIHYKNEHVINSVIETTKILQKKASVFKNDYDKMLIAKSIHSKEQELEADYQGLDLFLKTKYDPNAVNDAFFVLEFAHLPFDEIKFDPYFLVNKNAILSSETLLESVNPIESSDQKDDTYSTHPNIQLRKEKLQDLVDNAKGKDKKSFILPSEEFQEARKLARYEMTRTYLQDLQYGQTIYNCYLLLLEDSNDYFAEKCLVKALANLSYYKNRARSNDVISSYRSMQGESQQLFYFLTHFSSKELNLLTLARLAKSKAKYPDDQWIDYYYRLVNRDLISQHHIHYSDFKTPAKPVAFKELSDSSDAAEEETGEVSKYDRIKKKLANGGASEDGDVKTDFLYSFADFKSESWFKTIFDEENNRVEKEEKLALESKLTVKEKRKASKNREKHGRKLGVDKILVMEPAYFKVDYRSKKNQMKFVKSEQYKLDYMYRIESIASGLNLDVDVMSPIKMGPSDVEKWNDYSVLREWVTENFDHNDVKLVPANTEYCKQIMEKYGTRYVAFTALSSVKQYGYGRRQAALSCCYTVIGIPIGIYLYFSATTTNNFYFILFDLETGSAVLVEESFFRGKNTSAFLNSNLFHALDEVKNK